MLGFTLSKFNMLVLAIALFSVISFFMTSLTGIVIGNQAQQLVSAYIEKTSAAILSESLCFRTSVTVPEFITYFGGASGNERLFLYVLKISKIENPAAEGLSSIIMSVSNRHSLEKFLAAKRVDVKARIKIYNWDTSTDTIIESTSGATIIDPQAFPPVNSFVLIKEVFKDKTYLHVIPCSTGQSTAQGGICSNNTARVGCILKRDRGGVISACVPKLDTC